MIRKKRKNKSKAPCAQCPYRLGLIRTLVSPCLQCRASGYQTYKQFTGSWIWNRYGKRL